VSVYIARAMPICLRFEEQLIRRAAPRAAWTAGKRRPISIAMMAMTTSSSMSVKPAGRAEGRRAMDANLSAGPGERVPFDPPAHGSLQTVCERPARMLMAEASEQKLDGQVFWLTARNGSRTAFPPGGSGTLRPRAWPITAAAPRRIRTVFPIVPVPREEAWAPVEVGN
jgi:hypothetical protein